MVLRSCLMFIFAFLLPTAQAWAKFNYDIGVGQQYFAGKDEESLAPETGIVLRFGAQKGEEIFRYVTSLYITSSSGEVEFDDQGTSRELTYALLGGEFNLGFAIYPLGSVSKLALQPYLSVGGTAHLASISFDKEADVSDEFPKSDAAMMFGYGLAVGADIAFGKDWGGKIQVERTQLSGQLAGSTFGLSGQRVLFGLYFR